MHTIILKIMLQPTTHISVDLSSLAFPHIPEQYVTQQNLLFKYVTQRMPEIGIFIEYAGITNVCFN
jgi:hypothetical protein